MTAGAVIAAVPVLTFDHGVLKWLVHRQAVAEVFLTDSIRATSDDHFWLGAQWPRAHSFYRLAAPRYDAMLLAETLRQSAIYVAHRYYNVPRGRHFVMRRMSITAKPELLAIGATAADVSIEARVVRPAHALAELTSYTITLRFFIGGAEVGTGRGEVRVVSNEYDQIRWGVEGPRRVGPPVQCPPIEARQVGYHDSEHVVLGTAVTDSGNRWPLRVNLEHPVLFDHPCDHVPGMLIAEAMRQAARVFAESPTAEITEFDSAYSRFVEIDRPAHVVAEWLSTNRVRVTIEQRGRAVADGSVTLAKR